MRIISNARTRIACAQARYRARTSRIESDVSAGCINASHSLRHAWQRTATSMPELSGLVVALNGNPASAPHDAHCSGNQSARGMFAIHRNVS